MCALNRSTGVGDVGVEAIATRCPRLRVANLSYCIRITDAAMASLAKLNDLQQLELRGCRKVSSIGLTFLASGCKQLKELDMKHCSGVDDAGIFSLVTGCTQLRQVLLQWVHHKNQRIIVMFHPTYYRWRNVGYLIHPQSP